MISSFANTKSKTLLFVSFGLLLSVLSALIVLVSRGSNRSTDRSPR